MKVRAKQLPKKQYIEALDTLYTSAASIKGRQAMKLFLRDLLTESERIMLGRRIVIARRLIAGDSYDSIESDLKVGRDTIWRVQRWLFDQFPDFEQAIKGVEEEMERRRVKKDYAVSAFYHLRKKYPAHFLLLSVFKK